MSAPGGSRPPTSCRANWQNWPPKRPQVQEESSEESESEVETSNDDEELTDSSDQDHLADDDEDEDEDDDDDDIMASNANPPALPALAVPAPAPAPAPAAPIQGNPPFPFAPAPNNPGDVLCPLCVHPLKTVFKRSSMETHFLRKHNAQEYAQYFRTTPPPVHHCPFQCTNGPFIKRSDLHDHLSERHNQPLPRWRKIVNKQKRRQLAHLIADYVNEARSLNALIHRIRVAEANQPGNYFSWHGLPLASHFETNPALVPTNQADRVPVKRLDVATQLVALRNTADMMGLLSGGAAGTWDQVANELEARAAAYHAAVNQAMNPSLANA